MAKLAQKTVNDGCKVAQGRYASMPENDAKIAFSYELQGFAAAMAEDHGVALPIVLLKITELINMLAKANGI